jgi:hypothetical protein
MFRRKKLHLIEKDIPDLRERKHRAQRLINSAIGAMPVWIRKLPMSNTRIARAQNDYLSSVMDRFPCL